VLDEVDIVMGTFSKALASVGGFIAGPREVVDYLKHTARPFVFSASLPAASVAAAGAALEIIRKEPERRVRLLQVASALRTELRGHGFSVLDGETAIVPVVIREEGDLCRLCKALLAEKIYINPVLKPAAARNLLRISCTSAHTETHIERLVATLTKVATCLGIER
jgi:8-amino-7-oxononanoate synthase